MRFRVLLCLLVPICPGAFAQRENKVELALGIGTDIIRSSMTFKNDHNLSASFCYNFTDRWGLGLYVGQQAYSFDRLTSEHEVYLEPTKPNISKNVTSVLALGRYFIPTKLTRVSPYVSVGMGYSRSVSSSKGFYVVHNLSPDTGYFRIETGQFLLGLLSLGIEVETASFLSLFADLQQSFSSDQVLSPPTFGGRIGIAVTF